MTKHEWEEDLEDSEDDEDSENEDNEENYSVEDNSNEYVPIEKEHQPNPLEENKSSWGTIFWIIIIAVGAYYWLFDSNDSANTDKVASAPVIRLSPPPSPSPLINRSSPFVVPSIPRYITPWYSTPLYFNDYPCTEDCSGHEAGYEWAEDNDIDNFDDCGGNSNSFIEGCQSYVEENYPENVEE